MRIRTYRPGDVPTLVHIQQTAARFDAVRGMNESDFLPLLAQATSRFGDTVFLITDDDDEINIWGQGETLEGIEGETIGYTILLCHKDHRAYHFHCTGAVLPEHRHRGAGYALLLCALNHARIQSIDIVNDARQQGLPIYFEVELPLNDASVEQLARTFELKASEEPVQQGLRVYRTEL